MIDLVDARAGELGEAERAGVVAGAEHDDLAAARGDEVAQAVVDDAGADLHESDPVREAGDAAERGGALAGVAVDEVGELGRAEREAVRVVRQPDVIGQEAAEAAGGGDELRGPARGVVTHGGG